MSKKQNFTKAFKLEAVWLLESGDKPASEIAHDLEARSAIFEYIEVFYNRQRLHQTPFILSFLF